MSGRGSSRFRALLPALAALLLGLPMPGVGQTPDSAGWGGERALELIRRAQLRRAAAVDTGLVNYQARAHGRVYFYLDREDTGERNLVKTDQLALDVLWQAPNLVKQRIVGWRDERSLPTNINYHLDHLSVVQENFGEEIRLGDGDEVQGVIHPAAAAADDWYEYRLVDSLTLSLPGSAEPVRVYEVQARPRDPGSAAFVGSVFIERGRGDIVRMDFTFTSAAYVDRYLDYINISLDNGLWRGRYWLPNEQRVEIRRRIPQLDIPAGSVIRANMRVGEYVFNQPLPASTFTGPPVVALPREQREAFEFDEAIDAELREAGLGPAMELSEIRAEARRLLREQALRRVGGPRPGAGSVSELVRYNRAEGLALGAGLGMQPSAGLRLEGGAGYAFGPGHVLAHGRIAGDAYSLEAYLNRPVDRGIAPAASGAMNSLSSLLAGRDYSDLYYASGVESELRTRAGDAWLVTAGAALERHRAPQLEEEASPFGAGFRPVLPVDEGDVALGRLALAREAVSGRAQTYEMRGALAAGRTLGSGGAWWAEPRLDVGWTRRWSGADASAALTGSAGALLGDAPAQYGYLLGGRGTVPGFAFRSFGGSAFSLVRGELAADIAKPWVRGRALGSAGWVGRGDPVAPSVDTGGARAAIGVGAGLIYDILHVDLFRGLGAGGSWELVIEANPAFWGFL